MTTPERIEAMLDREAIRDLAHRYAVAVCSRDADDMAELFDVEVENGRWGPGRDGVRAFYGNFFQSDERPHLFHVGTHRVDLGDGDTATGVAFTRYLTTGADGTWNDTMIVYFDTYRRRDGEWFFVRRKETVGARLVVQAAPPVERPPGSRFVPPTEEHWSVWRAGRHGD